MPTNTQLTVELMQLSATKQLAFMLLVIERMLPILIAFCNDTKRDASCYVKAKDVGWVTLQCGKNDVNFSSLNQECLANAPDTERVSHKLTSYALNAAMAISDMLEFISDGQERHIASISSLAFDSVDAFVTTMEASFVYTPDLEQKIASHPLMKQELFRQEEDVKFLSRFPDGFDAETVSTVRARANKEAPLLPLTQWRQ